MFCCRSSQDHEGAQAKAKSQARETPATQSKDAKHYATVQTTGTRDPRVSWKDTNLALIGSELDHKIKAAAAGGETVWKGLGKKTGTKVWRIEQFKVVAWPSSKYGKFHTGDSYIVLHSFKNPGTDKLLHDVHIWIGNESSQDEYGTAAYKMVELDDFLGGVPVQHREVQGKESPMFLSYFHNISYLAGGVESGFTHIGASKDEPHLYKIKGTTKGVSMTQVNLSKSSLNQGDSFILFANTSLVWTWHGKSANPEEKTKANTVAESMCTAGRVVTIDGSEPERDNPEFFKYLGSGKIRAPEGGDESVKAFIPALYRIKDYGKGKAIKPEKIAEAKPIAVKWGPPVSKLQRSLLKEDDVFLLDAGWEVYLWMGKSCDKSEKLAGMTIAEDYMKNHSRISDLPLTIIKSGFETPHFKDFFEV